MVDPDARRVPDGDAVVTQDKADLEVADNDVVDVVQIKTAARDVSGSADTYHRLVGTNFGSRGEVEVAFDQDGPRNIISHRAAKVFDGFDRYALASRAARGCADRVVFGEALDVPGCESQEA